MTFDTRRLLVQSVMCLPGLMASQSLAHASADWISPISSTGSIYESSTRPDLCLRAEGLDRFWASLNEDADGQSLNSGAIAEIAQLLESLPLQIPLPESVLEDSGAIGLEWFVAPGNSFVVSLNGTGRAEYAEVLEGLGNSGWVPFTGAIPRDLLIKLGKHLKHAV